MNRAWLLLVFLVLLPSVSAFELVNVSGNVSLAQGHVLAFSNNSGVLGVGEGNRSVAVENASVRLRDGDEQIVVAEGAFNLSLWNLSVGEGDHASFVHVRSGFSMDGVGGLVVGWNCSRGDVRLCNGSLIVSGPLNFSLYDEGVVLRDGARLVRNGSGLYVWGGVRLVSSGYLYDVEGEAELHRRREPGYDAFLIHAEQEGVFGRLVAQRLIFNISDASVGWVNLSFDLVGENGAYRVVVDKGDLLSLARLEEDLEVQVLPGQPFGVELNDDRTLLSVDSQAAVGFAREDGREVRIGSAQEGADATVSAEQVMERLRTEASAFSSDALLEGVVGLYGLLVREGVARGGDPLDLSIRAAREVRAFIESIVEDPQELALIRASFLLRMLDSSPLLLATTDDASSQRLSGFLDEVASFVGRDVDRLMQGDFSPFKEFLPLPECEPLLDPACWESSTAFEQSSLAEFESLVLDQVIAGFAREGAYEDIDATIAGRLSRLELFVEDLYLLGNLQLLRALADPLSDSLSFVPGRQIPSDLGPSANDLLQIEVLRALVALDQLQIEIVEGEAELTRDATSFSSRRLNLLLGLAGEYARADRLEDALSVLDVADQSLLRVARELAEQEPSADRASAAHALARLRRSLHSQRAEIVRGGFNMILADHALLEQELLRVRGEYAGRSDRLEQLTAQDVGALQSSLSWAFTGGWGKDLLNGVGAFEESIAGIDEELERVIRAKQGVAVLRELALKGWSGREIVDWAFKEEELSADLLEGGHLERAQAILLRQDVRSVLSGVDAWGYPGDLRWLIGATNVHTPPVEEEFLELHHVPSEYRHLSIFEAQAHERFVSRAERFAMGSVGQLLTFVDDGVSPGTIAIGLSTGGLGGTLFSRSTGIVGASLGVVENVAFDVTAGSMLVSAGYDPQEHPLENMGINFAIAAGLGRLRLNGALTSQTIDPSVARGVLEEMGVQQRVIGEILAGEVTTQRVGRALRESVIFIEDDGVDLVLERLRVQSALAAQSAEELAGQGIARRGGAFIDSQGTMIETERQLKEYLAERAKAIKAGSRSAARAASVREGLEDVVLSLSREERLARWGDADELVLDFAPIRRYWDISRQHFVGGDQMPFDYKPLDPARTLFDEQGLPIKTIYRPADKVVLSRTVDVTPEVAKRLLESGKVSSLLFEQAGGSLDEYRRLLRQRGTDTPEKILDETWDHGPPGVNTAYSTVFQEGFSSQDEIVLRYRIEVPAERIVRVGGTFSDPKLPEAFRSIDDDEIFKHGFIEPGGDETEITFLGNIPDEYVKGVEVRPMRDGSPVDLDALTAEEPLPRVGVDAPAITHPVIGVYPVDQVHTWDDMELYVHSVAAVHGRGTRIPHMREGEYASLDQMLSWIRQEKMGMPIDDRYYTSAFGIRENVRRLRSGSGLDSFIVEGRFNPIEILDQNNVPVGVVHEVPGLGTIAPQQVRYLSSRKPVVAGGPYVWWERGFDAVAIDVQRDQAYKHFYQAYLRPSVDEIIQSSRGASRYERTGLILSEIYRLVDRSVPYSLNYAEEIYARYPSAKSRSLYSQRLPLIGGSCIGKGGVCRHQAILSANIVADLVRDGRLHNVVPSVNTAPGHGWAEVLYIPDEGIARIKRLFQNEPRDPQRYILDVTQHKNGWLPDLVRTGNGYVSTNNGYNDLRPLLPFRSSEAPVAGVIP